MTPIFCLLFLYSRTTHIAPPAPIPVPPKVKPGDKVEWIDCPAVKSLKDQSWGDVLTDIENHLPSSYGTHFRDKSLTTWAHETSHGISSYHNTKDPEYYHLYVGNNKLFRIKSPNITITQIAERVQTSLQKTRFNLYLIHQRKDWDKQPIYLWDEWVAYCNGAECGNELLEKNMLTTDKTDACWGVLEFSVYATYVAMVQAKLDENYDNKQMLEFLAWNLERSMKIYKKGQTFKEYNWDDDEYLNHLRTHVEASPFRRFLIKTYGAEWTEEVFGFSS